MVQDTAVSVFCNLEEAPVILWDALDTNGTVRASVVLVSRHAVSGGGWSDRPSTSKEPPGSASDTPVTFRSVKASSSSLKIFLRFVRSGGFSRHVAK